MSISDDEIEAAARGVCIAKGIDPDFCRDVSFPSATARAPREGAPAPTIQVLGKGPAAWEMEAPFVRIALSAASKVRAIREGDGEVAQGSCASCNGTGDTGGNPSYGMCPDCDGTGKFPPSPAATGGEKE